ncbi:uncharacterized protein LOC121731309 [Aricia agestis]|uniref:uncharacterized protein LOC121731309 n=1 Tax=Aricia agestis TaxID=91739 RepID=UPI001C207070|nr:uncharacterized protein LOC121731309 [Aricia agestis]
MNGTIFLFLTGLSVCCVQNAATLPRDSSVVVTEAITQADFEFHIDKEPKEIERYGLIQPHRVKCDYEEATEDASCQNHCLPKGYSYGICVSGTCSCV